jgi:hypothetical protein
MNTANLIYTHLYQFSTGQNKIRQKEWNIFKNIMNTEYFHLNKMWIKHLKWYYLKLSTHSESWHWFGSSVFHAEADITSTFEVMPLHSYLHINKNLVSENNFPCNSPLKIQLFIPILAFVQWLWGWLWSTVQATWDCHSVEVYSFSCSEITFRAMSAAQIFIA